MATSIAYTIFSPLSGFWSALERFNLTMGYSKAAAELARMGYYEESKKCMMEIQKLRS